MAEHRRDPRDGGVPAGRRTAALVALAGVLGMSGFGVSRVVAAAGGASSSCTSPSVIQVAAPEAIADSVQHAADAVEKTGGVCASFSVSAQNPGDTYQSIIASSEDEPQVWISDSPVWGELIEKKLGAGWVTVGDTIATSPVVLGVPASLRSKVPTGADAAATTWLDALDNTLPVSFVDTNASSASLESVVAANQQATDRKKRTALMKDVLRLSRSLTTPETMTARALEGADRARIFPVSEQQMQRFNGEHPARKLTAMVPAGGAKQLTYQWLTPVRGTQGDPAALAALKKQLLSPGEEQYRTVQGFRDASGSPLKNEGSLPASTPRMKPATTAEVIGADSAWTNLKKDARMLVLVDVSGSMLTPVDASGQTRIGLMEGTAIGALSSLPQTTRMGAWAFSTDLQRNHVDYLPLTKGEQRLTDTAYKDALVAKAHTLPELARKNGDTALYDSVAAAYKSVSDSYDPNYINSVVVLTDGSNDDPNGGLSLDQLLAELKAQYDIDKPVKIVTIALGTDTDPDALKKIAKATDGLTYTTSRPDQIASVFVDAFLHRSDY